MTITIGGTTFDRVEYDRGADVLYLHRGEPASATDFDETPEGHGLRFDSHGSLVGLTIVHPARLLGQGRPLTITIPTPVEVERSAVAAAMAATAA